MTISADSLLSRTRQRPARFWHARIWSARFWSALTIPLCLACLGGCLSMPWSNLGQGKEDPLDPRAGDSLVLRPGGLERDRGVVDPKLQADLDQARALYRDKEYRQAAKLFNKIARNNKNPIHVAEEALFYEAECQYQAGNLRDAEYTYRALLKEYRNGAHAGEANQRMFDIARGWLKDTIRQMEEYEEKRDGKRWFVAPITPVNFSKEKPMLDVEGHALQCLEDVRLHDIGGPLGEKATFYIATVKFYRQDYREADYYFTQLYERYPNSALAPKAIKQAIICKQIVNGGTCYDCRPVEESRKLIDVAARAYPQLVAKEEDWLQRQLVAVNTQQADRDFNIAEFYRRTGHPGSAFFYYELVKRRYPNTKYSEKAIDRMRELRDRWERDHPGQQPPLPPTDGGVVQLPAMDMGRPTPQGTAAPRPLPSLGAPRGVGQ